MGVALCHGIPRDIIVLVALLFYFVAFILEAVAIGRHNSKTCAGYITEKNNSHVRLGYIPGHPATYAANATHPDRASTKVCNPSASMLRYNCARYAEGYHGLNFVIISSFISCVGFFFIALFVVVRVSRSTTEIMWRITLLGLWPTGLQCAALVMFYCRVVHHAKRDFRVVYYPNDPNMELKYHRRYACSLMIAATALVSAGFLMLLIRFFAALCVFCRARRSKTPETDAKVLMKSHMVNDDWKRQKEVLRSHARSVQVELEIRKEDYADEQHTGAETDSAAASPSPAGSPGPQSTGSALGRPKASFHGSTSHHAPSDRPHSATDEDGFHFKRRDSAKATSEHANSATPVPAGAGSGERSPDVEPAAWSAESQERKQLSKARRDSARNTEAHSDANEPVNTENTAS